MPEPIRDVGDWEQEGIFMVRQLISTTFILSAGLSLLVSCSSLKVGKGGGSPQGIVHEKLKTTEFKTPVENVNKVDFESDGAEKQLQKIVSQAKEKGGKAPEYLASDLYLKASNASIHGELQTSVTLMKYVVELMPDETYLKRKYAVDLIRLGELKEAEQQLLSVYHEDKKPNENLGLILAGIYTALSETQKARDIYQEIRSAYPENQEACLFLSKSYATEKKFNKAKEVVRGCRKDIGDKALFSFYLGEGR